LCLKQLHIVNIKVFLRLQHISYICSSSTPSFSSASFSSPAKSTPCYLLIRHFPLLQTPVTHLVSVALSISSAHGQWKTKWAILVSFVYHHRVVSSYENSGDLQTNLEDRKHLKVRIFARCWNDLIRFRCNMSINVTKYFIHTYVLHMPIIKYIYTTC